MTVPPLDGCGCCEGTRELTPERLDNLPGRAALSYRVGTHGSFAETMKAVLSRQPALRGLRTREDDDPSIALLDAWATVLDVLTFYQERIANEGYLRTATESRSVAELAAAIGYRLRPGTAAGTYLAFELESAPGSPAAVTVGTGVKVQSLPGPGELPQVFEPVEEVEARPQWNAIRARTSRPSIPAQDATELYLAGVTSNLRPGDALLLVGDQRLEDPASDRWELRILASVQPDQQAGTTRVTWERPLGTLGGLTVDPAQVDLKVYALRLRASLFGHNAPDWRAMPAEVTRGYSSGYTTEPTDWPTLSIAHVGTGPGGRNPDCTVFLDQPYPQVVAGSWLVLSVPSAKTPGATDRELYRVESATEGSRTDFTLSGGTTVAVLAGRHLADLFDKRLRDTAVLAQSEQLQVAEAPLLDPVQGTTVELAGPVPRLAPGRTVLVSGHRPRLRVADGAAALRLQPDDGGAAIPLRPGETLTVLAPSAPASGGDRVWTVRHASGATGTVVAGQAQLRPVPAPDGDPTLLEVATVAPAGDGADTQTALELVADLATSYDRASFKVAANVVWATHGETRAEVLGSGDMAAPFQRFVLSQRPLTYVPAATASGGATTLAVRVGGVRWAEVPSLFGRGSRERVYVVRIGDDGRAVVEFGDGETGARLPSGQENVSAKYRVGTGLAGMVEAGKLTLLTSRPLGVNAVDNPLAASGASDPESRDRARENAPLTVLTLDRVVSLKDYEDFARAFSGVGKVAATWLWGGETRLVQLTAAADDGAPLTSTSVTHGKLAAAIAAAGDPRQPLRIDPYEPLSFDVGAGLYVDPAHAADEVLAAARDAVLEAFSFERRAFAQPVFKSEVEAVLQRVEGVTAVDLTALHQGTTDGIRAALQSLPARWEGGVIRAAQLLTVRPEGIALDART